MKAMERSKQQVVAEALTRRAGMMPEAKERLNARQEKLGDWQAYCRKCGNRMTATLKGLTTLACSNCGTINAPSRNRPLTPKP